MTFTIIDGRTVITDKPILLVFDGGQGKSPPRWLVQVSGAHADFYSVTQEEWKRILHLTRGEQPLTDRDGLEAV